LAHYCPNCKNLVKEGDRYCLECGFRLEWHNPVPEKWDNPVPEKSNDPDPGGCIDLLKGNSVEDAHAEQFKDQAAPPGPPIDNGPLQEEEPLQDDGPLQNNYQITDIKPPEPLQQNATKEDISPPGPPQEIELLPEEGPLEIADGLIHGQARDSDFRGSDSDTNVVFVKDDKKAEKKQAETSIADIVLRLGLVSVLILCLSFIWWMFALEGNFYSFRDLNLLIIFCSPGLIFGMAAIVLGKISFVRMKAHQSEKISQGKSVNGIILGAVTSGMVLSLIFTRLVFL